MRLRCSRHVYLLLILLTTMFFYVLYIKKERRDFIQNFYNDGETARKPTRHRMYARTINKLRAKIKKINTDQVIHNSHLGEITNKTSIVVIQCHSNVHHLQRLLSSLKKAYFINSSLLIFSHDYYSDKMNKLIQHINYAKYMQIFYPYSIQLHPKEFPGVERPSCSKDVSCVNSSRNPEAAQSKHHWWWQVNQIFDHMKALETFSEPILFLEANDYVILDVLFVFKLLSSAKIIHCPFCEMISLAAHELDLSKYNRSKSIITIGAWKDTMPNTAIAFNRKIWRDIKIWKELFCSYNDSNWDRSLKYLAAIKMEGNIYLLAIDGPRVFRIDDCEVKDVDCKEPDKMKAMNNFTKLIDKELFPLSLRVKVKVDEDFHATESGDWSDVRDHQLCMRFANESVWFIK